MNGKDITIITIGAALYRAVDAAKQLSEKYAMEADIINLHSRVLCKGNFLPATILLY